MVKKDIKKIIELQDASIEIKPTEIVVKGHGRELKRKIALPKKVKLNVEGKNLEISCENATKREAKVIGSLVAHIKNMLAGLKNEFVYKLEICNVHFPMNVKAEKEIVTIKSFLGEKAERRAKILPNVKVEIKGNIITISSHDKELAGQTAANIETAAKQTKKDRRVFQDGIFITEKCGRPI
jgi:large subunit ribosomal protein L6